VEDQGEYSDRGGGQEQQAEDYLLDEGHRTNTFPSPSEQLPHARSEDADATAARAS